jgi:hypothetical protein
MTETALKNMWVNKRVIAISNGFETNPNDASLSIGTFIDLIPITQSKNLIPLIKYDNEDEPRISFATILEYTDDLWVALNKLTAKERWSIIQAFCYRFQTR